MLRQTIRRQNHQRGSTHRTFDDLHPLRRLMRRSTDGKFMSWTFFPISKSYRTSVRQRRRPLYGYSPPSAYVRQRRRLQYGYGPTATYVRLRLQYISDAVSE